MGSHRVSVLTSHFWVCLLQIQKRHSSGSMDDRPSLSARDYVESLHQNSRATLLYGKNNVLVQPVSSCWDTRPWELCSAPLQPRLLLDGEKHVFNLGRQ